MAKSSKLSKLIGFSLKAASIPIFLACSSAEAEQERPMGEPFRTVFPVTGMTPGWWIAEYDHRSDWQQTAWRRSGVEFSAKGLEISLFPAEPDQIIPPEIFREKGKAYIEAGKTTKPFISGQLQRGGWFGYGRYEIIMQSAAESGLITAFYTYTGRYFNDSHEEIDIEIVGKDTTKVQFNRFRNGVRLKESIWVDVGFDTSERPNLYSFEWTQDRLTWYVNEREMYRLDGADEIPIPPAKIYLDLWTGGPGQVKWAGPKPEDATGTALVQCVSYSPSDRITPQCSDLLAER